MTDPKQLVHQFALSRRDDPFSREDLIKHLADHGITGVEAEMAIDAWRSENVGGDREPDFDFIREMGLPVDANDMTNDQLTAMAALSGYLGEEAIKAQAEFDNIYAEAKAFWKEHPNAKLGELGELGQRLIRAEDKLDRIGAVNRGMEEYTKELE